MSRYSELYNSKLMAAQDAVKLVKNDDWIIVPLPGSEPPALLEALSDLRYDLEGVVVNQILPVRKFKYMDQDSKILHNAFFAGGPTREGINGGWSTFTANYFYDVKNLLIDYNRTDVVMCAVSSMDEHGYMSLSCGVDYTYDCLANAREIIVEVNENLPRTHGVCWVHVSQVSAIVENNIPALELSIPALTETDKKIGGYIAELIPDGACIQIGWGGIPNAVCEALKDKKHLGIHTEMITDGMADLVYSGAVDCSKKNFHHGKIIGTFVLGTNKLYKFVHDNPMIEMRSVHYTNDPYIIGQNDNMHSVNSAIEVDLYGQVASETMGTYIWSGTGGQADFANGAIRSKGGKGILAVAATAKKGTVSRIVPTLSPGAHVTTHKNAVDHIATEYGVAYLRGKNARQRAEALINVAAPEFRADLRAAAKKMNILP